MRGGLIGDAIAVPAVVADGVGRLPVEPPPQADAAASIIVMTASDGRMRAVRIMLSAYVRGVFAT